MITERLGDGLGPEMLLGKWQQGFGVGECPQMLGNKTCSPGRCLTGSKCHSLVYFTDSKKCLKKPCCTNEITTTTPPHFFLSRSDSYLPLNLCVAFFPLPECMCSEGKEFTFHRTYKKVCAFLPVL